MDKVETIAPKLFLGCAVVALFSCLSRPDFNLPLFVFSWFVWQQTERAVRFKLFLLLTITLLVDLVWLFYWGSYFGRQDEYGKWEQGVHHFTMMMSVIGFIGKIGAMVIVGLSEKTQLMIAYQDATDLTKQLAAKIPKSNEPQQQPQQQNFQQQNYGQQQFQNPQQQYGQQPGRASPGQGYYN